MMQTEYPTLIFDKFDAVAIALLQDYLSHSKSFSTFWKCDLTSITIPNSVTEIGNYAFYNCSNLRNITIGDNVTSIGSWTFDGCSSLTEIVLPNSLTTLGYDAFGGCTNLKRINLPNGITEIDDYTFYKCSSLTTITIPDGVTQIGDQTFYKCSNLSEIICLAVTPPTIKSNTFSYVNHDIPLYVPAASVEAYRTANYWKEFTNIQGIIPDIASIHLRVDHIALYPEESYYLNTVVLPIEADKSTLIWTTSDEDVATVDSTGFVTAHSVGKATITVSTSDYALSASCLLTVVDTDLASDVMVETTENSALFTWATVAEAFKYQFSVYTNDAQTDLVCKLTCNAWGQLIGVSFPHKKAATEQPALGTLLQFVVDGLQSGTVYSFTLNGYSENEEVVLDKAGTFITSGSPSTRVETLSYSVSDEVRKVFENGIIYILRGSEKYTIDGLRVE